MEYFIWSSRRMEGFCVLEPPELEDEWELDDGVPQLSKWEDEVVCHMDPEYPNDLQLGGSIYGAGMPVVSQHTREVIEGQLHASNRAEFLPVSIVNHKGRAIAEDFYILHPLELCDCIDVDESGVEWNSISKGLISCCEGLVLDHARIPNELSLFRLKHWGEKIVVREDLRNVLVAAEITGLHFVSAQGFTGMP